jgi:DNA-binding transcriptional MerR regulator
MLESEAEPGSAGLLGIGAVARELGVAPSTLRTWERRYHLVVPHRGGRGQRLYDPDQVIVLRRILALVRRGTRASAAHDLALIPRPIRT